MDFFSLSLSKSIKLAHMIFFWIILFSILFFIESHTAVLQNGSYQNIPDLYFHSSM